MKDIYNNNNISGDILDNIEMVDNNIKMIEGDTNNMDNIIGYHNNSFNNIDNVLLDVSDPNIGNIGGQNPGNLKKDDIKQHKQNNIIGISKIYKNNINIKNKENSNNILNSNNNETLYNNLIDDDNDITMNDLFYSDNSINSHLNTINISNNSGISSGGCHTIHCDDDNINPINIIDDDIEMNDILLQNNSNKPEINHGVDLDNVKNSYNNNNNNNINHINHENEFIHNEYYYNKLIKSFDAMFHVPNELILDKYTSKDDLIYMDHYYNAMNANEFDPEYHVNGAEPEPFKNLLFNHPQYMNLSLNTNINGDIPLYTIPLNVVQPFKQTIISVADTCSNVNAINGKTALEYNNKLIKLNEPALIKTGKGMKHMNIYQYD